jgi:hypothetical protein
MNGIKTLGWRPLRKTNLLGCCKVELPSGMIMDDVTVLLSHRGAWASPPSKPLISRDGVVMKDETGKLRYCPLIQFASSEVRNRRSDLVIEAMRAAHPEVFE